MAKTKSTLRLMVLLIAVTANQTCCGQTEEKEGSNEFKKNKIKSILTAQAGAWNEGNLPKFMETYWKSDKLSFSSGGKTTFGWQGTLDNYIQGYAPPKEMGKLNFDGLQISMIETNSALVLGKWHLKMKNNVKRDGNFSLVVKKMETGWKIIHDHSSELEKKELPQDNQSHD